MSVDAPDRTVLPIIGVLGPVRSSIETTTDDSALRADVRRMVGLLGRTLTRHEGEEFFALVEELRQLGGEGSSVRIRDRLTALPSETIGMLVRAFLAYFHLVNVAEQVDRVRSFQLRAEDDGWLPRAAAAIVAHEGPPGLAGVADFLSVQPVFTAHPTEASRRSVLTKLLTLSDILAAPRAGSTERARQDRKLAELIDLLWQTDELRRDRPSPVDEARNALYYLEAIVADTLPELTEQLADVLERRACGCPAKRDRSPWAAGSAATGTATPTSQR